MIDINYIVDHLKNPVCEIVVRQIMLAFRPL